MKLISEETDPFSGITTQYFANGSKVTVRKLQNVEPALIKNVQEFNAHSSKSRFGKKEGMGRKVASIPPAVIEKLAAEGRNILTFTDQQMKDFLNDPEYSKLRTAPGRL
ncbi:MAG: hypothetical protein KAR40_07925 [Candidatus Sabulitectum sp.]|nr:hypothetical protein [Candidatus Sabulitectum sp.]